MEKKPTMVIYQNNLIFFNKYITYELLVYYVKTMVLWKKL